MKRISGAREGRLDVRSEEQELAFSFRREELTETSAVEELKRN